MNREIKNIRFWLNRVSEEYNTQAITLIEKSGELFFKAHNFEEMSNSIRLEVVRDLQEKMRKLGWYKEAKEIDKSIQKTGEKE